MNKSYSHLENHTRSMDLEFLLIDLVSSRDKFSKAVVNYNFIKEDQVGYKINHYNLKKMAFLDDYINNLEQYSVVDFSSVLEFARNY